MDKKILGYNFMDVVGSDKFYDKLVSCANITNKGGESSMAVNGYKKNYVVTNPMEEDRHRALSGSHRGLNFIKKGYGFYKPDNAFRIINLHYHPPDNIAIPSTEDFVEDPETLRDVLIDALYLTKPVQIIGHKKDKKIILFAKQLLLNYSDCGDEFFDSVANEFNTKLMKKTDLDYSNKDLPYYAARILNDTGNYLAKVISFENKEEYLSKISLFEGFKILEPLKDLSFDPLKESERFNEKSLDSYFRELDEEEWKNKHGVSFEEEDEFFVNGDHLFN